MSRILRRPMFRGGKVSSYGKGIASGLGKPGYDDGGEVLGMYESIREKLPSSESQGLSTGDYLRIASAGLDILGAPSEGGGIKGVLATASKPLSKLGVDLGTAIDARKQKAMEERNELARTITGAQVEYDVGMEKAQGEFRRKEIAFDAVTEVKRESVRNDGTLSEEEKTAKLQDIEDRYNADKEFFLIKGGDVSDFYKLGSQTEMIKAANRAAKKAIKSAVGSDGEKITPEHPEYLSKLAELQAQYLAIMTQQFGKQFAEGGAVTEDVNVMTETPTGITDVNVEEQYNPQQLSYDELRARLPKEIGDDIVTLLANSYEALGDFAQIRTQTDVDQFNQKYQVQLVLPQEA